MDKLKRELLVTALVTSYILLVSRLNMNITLNKFYSFAMFVSVILASVGITRVQRVKN
jgi:hypothetical protein